MPTRFFDAFNHSGKITDAGEVVLRPTYPWTQRITRDVTTDLRSEPGRMQPSSLLYSTPRPWAHRNLPLPIPGEGRKPVASPRVSFQSLRATLIGSMPACFHHARSSRERCTAR